MVATEIKNKNQAQHGIAEIRLLQPKRNDLRRTHRAIPRLRESKKGEDDLTWDVGNHTVFRGGQSHAVTDGASVVKMTA